MKDKTIITLVGIISIVILESVALFNGIDGIMLTATIGAITTIVGYNYGKSKCEQK